MANLTDDRKGTGVDSGAILPSLLWPPDLEGTAGLQGANPLGAEVVADLGLDAVVDALRTRSGQTRRIESLRTHLLTLCPYPQVIRYRQEILEDFLNQPSLMAGLGALLPKLGELGYINPYLRNTSLEQVLARLGELELYVQGVTQLHALLDTAGEPLRSAGLCGLRASLGRLEAEASFQQLAQQLPELREKASGVASLTLGINLDAQLRPVQVTLLSINDRRFTGRSDTWLSRVLSPPDGRNEYQGLGPLHSTSPSEAGFGPNLSGGVRSETQLLPLFQDLNHILIEALQPVARALRKYLHLQTQPLVPLESELAFYLGAARLIQDLQAAGLPMCRPEIVHMEARVGQIEGLYNVNLALRRLAQEGNLRPAIIPNDLNLPPEERILILTGPNHGGKTTFTQGMGLAQVLFQAGLYVPGRAARISPVDGIYTHFPRPEQTSIEEGRLGEEAQRLSRIFQRATRHSLVLLNETFSTTSPGESIYLARDVVRGLRLLGVRAIFVTHLHELAEDIDRLESTTPGDSRIVSLVAGIRAGEGAEAKVEPSYKIVPAPPLGSSYAQEIARHHGISYEQLARTLQARNALSDNRLPH